MSINIEDRSVKIQPSCVLTILDHYMRREDEKQRVIGTLLGFINDGVVTVTSCYPVPHVEKEEGDVAIGKDFHKTMYALHQNVNIRDKIVGWYATSSEGVDIPDVSVFIHDYFAHECKHPIHVVVDTSLKGNTLSVKAFNSLPIMLADNAVGAHFNQLELEMLKDEATKVGIDAMIKSSHFIEEKEDMACILASDLDNLQTSMTRLHHLLELACNFVDKTISGEIEPNYAVGRMLSEAINAVPKINPATFDKMFNDSMQDLLMVVYLTSLGRTQLAITEKLNSMLK